jgi:hypothetical protein
MVIGKFFLKKNYNQLESNWIQIATENLQRSSKLLPLAGYFILALIFLDYLFLLIPPQFFNPSWELNVIGHLVENVWAPLLGFLLVFTRKSEEPIKLQEVRLLAWLSRLVLLMAIFYLLAVPLTISNTIRIQQKNFSQFSAQVDQQRNQVTQIEEQINQMPEDNLKQFMSQFPSASATDSSATIKEKLLSQLKQEQTTSLKQAKAAYNRQKLSFFKTSVKWGIGTLLSGIMLILVWRYTEWARKIPAQIQE